MFFCSDDPAMDLIRYQSTLKPPRVRKPRCNECGCKLGDHCFEVDDEYLCQDCFDDAFKVRLQEDAICDSCEKPIESDTAYKIDGVYLCKEDAYFAYHRSTPEYDD